MLDRRTFLIKEHVGFAKLHEVYDIIDPSNGEKIGEAREEASTVIKLLKFVLNKTMLPFRIVIRDAQGTELVEVRRGWTFFRSVAMPYMLGRLCPQRSVTAINHESSQIHDFVILS